MTKIQDRPHHPGVKETPWRVTHELVQFWPLLPCAGDPHSDVFLGNLLT